MMIKAKGDAKFFLAAIPSVVSKFLAYGKKISSEERTLAALGDSRIKLFTYKDNFFPNEWKPGFSSYLRKLNSTVDHPLYKKVKRVVFNVTEMRALYGVLSDPVSLGVAKQPPISLCMLNPLHSVCLNSGFLFIWEAFKVLKTHFLGRFISPLYLRKLKSMLCPNISNKCLLVSEVMLASISDYIQKHMTILSAHLAGLVDTRSQSELSMGYTIRIMNTDYKNTWFSLETITLV